MSQFFNFPTRLCDFQQNQNLHFSIFCCSCQIRHQLLFPPFLFECYFSIKFSNRILICICWPLKKKVLNILCSALTPSVPKCKQKLVNKSECIWSESLTKYIKFLWLIFAYILGRREYIYLVNCSCSSTYKIIICK
jgi:hypothetical protein